MADQNFEEINLTKDASENPINIPVEISPEISLNTPKNLPIDIPQTENFSPLLKKSISLEKSETTEINVFKAFEAIAEFIEALHETFHNNKPLALYNRFIERTPARDKTKLQVHIDIFKKYIDENGNSIVKGAMGSLPPIQLSQNIFIDLPLFIKENDKQVNQCIKNYLINIFQLIDPHNPLLIKVVQDQLKIPQSSTKEGQFLGDLMNDMMSGLDDVDENSNPMMTVMSKAMGILPKVMSGLQSGDMNPQELFGALGGMMNGLSGAPSQGSGQNPFGDQNPMNMLTQMMGAMGGADMMNNLNPSSSSSSTSSSSTPKKKGKGKKK